MIAIPHQKWTERPLLVVVPAAKSSLSRDDMLDFLQVRPVTAVQLFKPNTRHTPTVTCHLTRLGHATVATSVNDRPGCCF